MKPAVSQVARFMLVPALIALSTGGCWPFDRTSDSSSNTSTTPPPVNYREFAYTANFNADTLSAFSIDATTGALTKISDYATCDAPNWFTVHPNKRFLYITCFNSDNVEVYSINQTTGALTSLGTVAAGTTPQHIAIDPSGSTAHVASSGSEEIRRYTVDSSTGALTYAASYPVPATDGLGLPFSLKFDSTGKFMIYGTDGNPAIDVLDVDLSTRALSNGGTRAQAHGGTVFEIAVHPASGRVYVVNSANQVKVYSMNASTGVLTELSDFTPTSGSNALAIHPSGKFAYTSNASTAEVSVLAIDGPTGALSEVEAETVGGSPGSVRVNVNGKFAYVARGGSNALGAYTVDQTTGALTHIESEDLGVDPWDVLIVSIPE